MVATHLTQGLENEALGNGSRHWHGGPSYAGKMGVCPGCEGATRVAHIAGVTEDGTKRSVRLHRRNDVDQYRRESSSWWHGLLARALKQAGSLFYHFLAGGGITDFVRQISSGTKPGEPGSAHERLMSRICAPALSRSLQQCVYWSGVE